MKATRFLLGALLLLLCGTVLQAQPSLVPKPAQATWGKGKFTIQPQTTIAYGDKALQPAADYLASSLQRLTGVRPKTQRGGKGDILLQIDRKGVKGEGAYRLTVEKARITVKGHDYGAITSAIATLRQITEGKGWPPARSATLRASAGAVSISTARATSSPWPRWRRPSTSWRSTSSTASTGT